MAEGKYNEEEVKDEDEVELESFKMYESTDDETKMVDGEPHVKDFHMYPEKDEDDEGD
jgi:hypothetical protein